MTSRPIRLLNAVAILCVSAVAIALISQHVFDMRPCAWCVFQRLIFLLIAVVCWITTLFARYWPGTLRIGGVLVALLGLGGVAAAWYQHTVASVLFSCDQTFADRFMTNTGLDAGMPWIFGIFATCMDAKIKLLGLEYTLWSMALFILIAIVGGVVALRKQTA